MQCTVGPGLPKVPFQNPEFITAPWTPRFSSDSSLSSCSVAVFMFDPISGHPFYTTEALVLKAVTVKSDRGVRSLRFSNYLRANIFWIHVVIYFKNLSFFSGGGGHDSTCIRYRYPWIEQSVQVTRAIQLLG